MKNIDDDVIMYNTTLCFGHSFYSTIDSILDLLWRNRRKQDYFGLLGLKFLFTMAIKIEALAQLLIELPPPTY